MVGARAPSICAPVIVIYVVVLALLALSQLSAASQAAFAQSTKRIIKWASKRLHASAHKQRTPNERPAPIKRKKQVAGWLLVIAMSQAELSFAAAAALASSLALRRLDVAMAQ